MVELRGIGKYFPSNGVRALRNANLTLLPGEIHALLGENGTGKSTLMHILAGYLAPSSGTVLVDGIERRFSAPADALARGIGMVRQHPAFVKGFKVWEDCVLGSERAAPSEPGRRPDKRGGVFFNALRGLFLDPGGLKKRVGELSDRWNFDLPLERESESLTVGQRQKAAVLALLLRDARWFVFDEPTAVLTPEEAGILFDLFRRLRSEGRGIVLITHKLEEALSICDRITVIRGGTTMEPRKAAGLDAGDLKKAIFGEWGAAGSQPPAPLSRARPAEKKPELPPVLAVRNLTLRPPGLPALRNVNFELAPGKILGIAGARDSGLETLELALAGLLENPGKIEGSIALNGREIAGKGARAFRGAGGAYLGADRLDKNLAPEFPLKESLIIHAFRRAARGAAGFLDTRFLDSWCRRIMEKAGIERSVSDRADSFSGGMLQRVLLAREFAEKASLAVLSEAGSGLDEFNRLKLDDDLKGLARAGAAALLFSTDPDELASVADEILELKDGSIGPPAEKREGRHGL